MDIDEPDQESDYCPVVVPIDEECPTASDTSPDAIVASTSSRTSEFLRNLKKIHEDWGWDVQLQIGTKLFKTDRTWLATHSAFFRDMLMSKSDYTRDQPITLEDIDATEFEEFYHFIYSYDLRVNDFNVLQLLQLNDKLRVWKHSFKEKCIEYVKSRSEAPEPISNVLDLLEFASQKKEDSLVHFLHAHISSHLYHYSKEACLEELSFECMSSLLKFSKNYILPLRVSEKVIQMIIHNWISHNRVERGLQGLVLMENIDGANVSPGCSELLVDGQDEVAKDTESLSKLKTLETGLDTDLTGDGAQLSAKVSFNVQNINKLQIGENVSSSSSTIISNLMWKIGVRRDDDSLSIYLDCGGTELSSEWSCYANASFTITSSKEGEEYFITAFNFGIFSSSNEDDRRHVWFVDNALDWNDLINPENGYIKDDGSVCLNAHVQADVPFRKFM